MKKVILILALAAISCTSLAACSNDTDTSSTDDTSSVVSSVENSNSETSNESADTSENNSEDNSEESSNDSEDIEDSNDSEDSNDTDLGEAVSEHVFDLVGKSVKETVLGEIKDADLKLFDDLQSTISGNKYTFDLISDVRIADAPYRITTTTIRDGDNAYLKTNTQDSIIVFKDGTCYLINETDKTYCITDEYASVEDAYRLFTIEDMFSDVKSEYVTEVNKAKLDEKDYTKYTIVIQDTTLYVYAVDNKIELMFAVDDENNVGNVVYINTISDEVDESVFDIPEDYTEVTEDEF